MFSYRYKATEYTSSNAELYPIQYLSIQTVTPILGLAWMRNYLTFISALSYLWSRVAMTASVATVLCFRGMSLLSVISDPGCGLVVLVY